MFPHPQWTPTDTLKRMTETPKEWRRASDLNGEEVEQMRQLNRYLKEYERKIKIELEKLYQYAMEKVDDPDEWIDGYEEIEVTVYYSLDEDDDAWSEDDDNIIISMVGCQPRS